MNMNIKVREAAEHVGVFIANTFNREIPSKTSIADMRTAYCTLRAILDGIQL